MVPERGVVVLVESVRILNGDERDNKYSQEVMLGLKK